MEVPAEEQRREEEGQRRAAQEETRRREEEERRSIRWVLMDSFHDTVLRLLLHSINLHSLCHGDICEACKLHSTSGPTAPALFKTGG